LSNEQSDALAVAGCVAHGVDEVHDLRFVLDAEEQLDA
jgi:hypothetical protein